VTNDYRQQPLPEPVVPLPWNAHQCCGANNDGPADEPEHDGLPHGWREDDKRRPDQQAKNLFDVVRSRGARETYQEALSNHRFRQSHAREDDKEEAKPDNDDSCHLAHELAGALKSRITVELSGAAASVWAWHFIFQASAPEICWAADVYKRFHALLAASKKVMPANKMRLLPNSVTVKG
jgi:hypothetical protein